MTAPPGLVRFVRHTLGCGCPDEIVNLTVVEESAAGEPGLNVGGRLLVRVLSAEDPDRFGDDFPATVKRLLAERDDRGFNRLRMVVTRAGVGTVVDELVRLLEDAAAGDDRVFIHLVPEVELPHELRS